MHSSKYNHLSAYQLMNCHGHHNSESRTVMSSQHLNQFIPIKDADRPRSYSVYNSILIEESSKTHKRTNGKSKVLASFNLFSKKYNILQDIDNKHLNLVDMSPIVKESGFTANLNGTPKVGDIINKNELIYTTDETNKNLELTIGKNINTAIMVYGNNFADAYVCSQSFANSFRHTETKEIEFVINSNELLVNCYGDDKKYKPFPSIGERVNPNDNILMAKRKLNKDLLAYCTNSMINSIHFSQDEIFYADGVIKNIFVLRNIKDENSFSNNYSSSMQYLDNIHSELKDEAIRFYEFVNGFITENPEYTVDAELKKLYQKVINLYLSEKPTKFNDTEFNGYLIKFTIVKADVPIKNGSKITSFHASKGLISEIIPDDEMPIDENGDRIDLILNTNSIISRQNLGLIIEIILNNILKYIFKQDDINDVYKLYMALNKVLNKDTHILEDLKSIGKRKLVKILTDMKKNNDYCIVLEPYSENNTFMNIRDFAEKYNIPIYNNLSYKNGKKIIGKCLNGDLYVLKLKHEPKKKMSYVSFNQTSDRTKQPSKGTLDFKKSKAINNHTSSSIAEMEFINLLTLSRDNFILKELLFLKSSDLANREKYARDLLYSDTLSIYDYEDKKHNTANLLRQVFLVLGLEF